MIVLAILTVTLSMFSSLMASTAQLAPINREMELAVNAGRNIVESMRNTPFEEVFLRYNADPADDPGGAGTAAGASFDVVGLDPQTGDPDGMVGIIIFPTVGNELREDASEPRLGMPRDLNGDGAVDDVDHRADAILIPIQVRIEWDGRLGDRQVELFTMVADI